MGLDPKFLETVTDDIETLFYELETEILKDIANRIQDNDFSMTSTAQYQKAQLKALGMLENDINKHISETLGISTEELSTIMKSSVDKAVASDNAVFKMADDKDLIQFKDNSSALKKILEQELKGTNKIIANICKTTAINSQKAFINACDKLFIAIKSGSFDYNSAMMQAIDELTKNGTGYITYESGTRRRLDSAIKQTVRTAVNQTALKCQDENFELMGGNLVETSAHIGARDTHANWQGKVFYRKQPVKGYSEFISSTQYLSADGLGGVNCRHSWYPFFPELGSTQVDYDFNSKENKKQYDLEQEQRHMERTIRTWNRKKEVKDSANLDSIRETIKVKYWNARLNQLVKNNPTLKKDNSALKV